MGGAVQNNITWELNTLTKTGVWNAGFTGFIFPGSIPLDIDVRMAHNIAGAVSITMLYANLNMIHIGGGGANDSVPAPPV